MSHTSSADEASSALSVSCLQDRKFNFDMSERTVATLAAGTLTVFTPAPISSGSTRGSAAASPHTETEIPASLPALAIP